MKETTKGRFLRRYTELPYLIDYLTTKELTLLNPKSWDDRNDSYYLRQYGVTTGQSSIFSLCLTETSETYHHWRIFSNGASGVCIEFDKDIFVDRVFSVPGLMARSVIYKTLVDMRDCPPRTEDLPFLKRYAFGDEKEFRIFIAKEKHPSPVFKVRIGLAAISRIVLSPWIPKEVSNHVKSALKSIPGCSKLKVYRSTLVENEAWKRFAENREEV